MCKRRLSTEMTCLFLGAALFAPLVGCGGRNTGTVAGNIAFRGQPLANGTVAFILQDGKVASSTIHEGTYRMEKVGVGPVKITVHVFPPPPMVHPPTGPAAGVEQRPLPKFVPIPDRYAHPEQSGLSYTVVAGPQTHDMNLEPK